MREVINYEGNAAGGSGSPRVFIKASNVYFNFIEEDNKYIYLNLIQWMNV